MNCPKCGLPMEHIDDEPDVNIIGGYLCTPCEEFIPIYELDHFDDLYLD